MTLGQKVTISVAVIGAAGAIIASLAPPMIQHFSSQPSLVLYGAVMKADADPQKWFPIPDVEISDEEGLLEKTTISDDRGGFALHLKNIVKMGQAITLKLRKNGYNAANIHEAIGEKLYTEYLVPAKAAARALGSVRFIPVDTNEKEIVGLDILAHNKDANTTIATFYAVNHGNTPCSRGDVCSPDGKWKAAIASQEIAAEGDGELKDPKIRCVAGPCPFTQTEISRTSKGRITFTAKTWSETATFEAQATETKGSNQHLQVSIKERSFTMYHGAPAFTAILTAQFADGEKQTERFAPAGDEKDLRQRTLELKIATCHQFRFNGSGNYVFTCKLDAQYRFGPQVLQFPQFNGAP